MLRTKVFPFVNNCLCIIGGVWVIILLMWVVGVDLWHQPRLFDGGHQTSDSRHINPFTIPIVQELHANFTKAANLPEAILPNLQALDFQESADLGAHHREAFHTVRIAKMSKDAFIRSLTRVEGLFSSVDLNGLYDPAALSFQSSQQSTLRDSIIKSVSMRKDISRIRFSLEGLLGDMEKVQTVLMKDEEHHFHEWLSSYWVMPEKLIFIVENRLNKVTSK